MQDQEVNLKLWVEINLLPKNLEIAHLSHSKLFIDENLNEFGNFLKIIENNRMWVENFYPDGFLDKLI